MKAKLAHSDLNSDLMGAEDARRCTESRGEVAMTNVAKPYRPLLLFLAPVLTLALVACGDGGQSVDYDGTWNCKMGFPKTGSISFNVTGSQVTVNISHAGACDVSGKIEGNGFDLERWISGFGDLGHCEARGVFRDADHCDITRWRWGPSIGTATCTRGN